MLQEKEKRGWCELRREAAAITEIAMHHQEQHQDDEVTLLLSTVR